MEREVAREKEREGAQQMQQKVTGKGLLSKGWFVKHVAFFGPERQ